MTNPKIVVNKEVKEKLDKMKIHPRETYNDVLKRILKSPLKLMKGGKENEKNK